MVPRMVVGSCRGKYRKVDAVEVKVKAYRTDGARSARHLPRGTDQARCQSTNVRLTTL